MLAPAAALALTALACAPALAQSADERLRALLTEDVAAQSRRSPIEASARGLTEFDTELAPVSPEDEARWVEESRARLAALRAIDAGQLSEEGALDAALLERELETRIELGGFRAWRAPIDQLNGPHIWLASIPDQLNLPTRSHLERYLERISGIPGHFEQITENMRLGLREGWTPPGEIIAPAADQALSQGAPGYEADPSQHPLFRPFLRLEEGDELRVSAERAVGERIVPAYRALGAFLRDEYIPACRETIGISELDGGAAYYEALLRYHTTTPMTAQEIHSAGVFEVGRIRQEMMRTIARSDFENPQGLEGDALFRAFVEHLRESDRFYFDTPEALLTAYRDIAKRIDAEMPTLFAVLPRNSYGVEEMPSHLAPSAPTAYYMPGSLRGGVAGTFIANTYNLRARPRYEMIALTLHEAVPGHHHQIALAQELEGQHEWRTLLGYTAYVEGWALYAERLGLEMGGGELGLYADPYDDFGRLSYEMWRAMRLVVDTGIHAMGWSRERAIEFMLENSALTRENVAREVDRYIVMPGQATAYKIGELEIRGMRWMAERALGDRFDVRAFHDEMLGAGALPLDVLRERMQRWIQSQLDAG